MTTKEARRVLKQRGFVLVRHGGKHEIWSDGKETIALPYGMNELRGFLRKAVLSGRGARTKQGGS